MRIIPIIVSIFLALLPAAARAQEPTALATVQSFQEAGMPIDNIVALDETTDPNHLLGRPGQYVEKVDWHDTRLPALSSHGIGDGGTIERFATPADLERRHTYLKALDGTVFGREYRYENGLMLLRVPFDFTPGQAAEYAALFGVPA